MRRWLSKKASRLNILKSLPVTNGLGGQQGFSVRNGELEGEALRQELERGERKMGEWVSERLGDWNLGIGRGIEAHYFAKLTAISLSCLYSMRPDQNYLLTVVVLRCCIPVVVIIHFCLTLFNGEPFLPPPSILPAFLQSLADETVNRENENPVVMVIHLKKSHALVQEREQGRSP